MGEHDYLSFIAALGARLATRSRHVAVLLGAGSSRACGLPDVAMLQERISDGLDGEQARAFTELVRERNLEGVLSRVRRIASLVEDGDTVNGLTADTAKALDEKICALIVGALTPSSLDFEPVWRFAAWAARADYTRPLEIFTVNYDLLIETALERWSAPYFDGFVGNIVGRFRSDLVDSSPKDESQSIPRSFTRLWKLHGSLNWSWTDDRGSSEVVRLGTPVAAGQTAAIYPSDAKYDESRRMPFVALQDRFRTSLNEPETLLLVSGYSWADEHLNEPIFDAVGRRPRSEVIAFCFDDIPDSLAERALMAPNLQVVAKNEAIMGGIRGQWNQPGKSIPTDLWSEGSSLGDFRFLASYLSRAMSSDPLRDIDRGTKAQEASVAGGE